MGLSWNYLLQTFCLKMGKDKMESEKESLVYNSSEIQVGWLQLECFGYVSRPGNNHWLSTPPSESWFYLLNYSYSFWESSICLQLSSFLSLLSTNRIWGKSGSLSILVPAGSVYAEAVFSRTLGFVWVEQGLTALDNSFTWNFFQEMKSSFFYLCLLLKWLRHSCKAYRGP